MDIIIRRAEPADAAAIHAIYASPRVIWGTLQLPYPSVAQHERRLAEAGDARYPLLATAAGEVVGHLNLTTYPHSPRRRHVGSMGMGVRDDWQGRGVGTTLMRAVVDLADRWLNLTRLELDVFTDNEPAVHLYQKFGFAIEGTRLNYAYRDGRYADVYLMGRLKAEK